MQTNNDGSDSPRQEAPGVQQSLSEEGSPGCANFQAALMAMSRVRLGAVVVRLPPPPDDEEVVEGHMVVQALTGDAHHHCAPQDPGGEVEGEAEEESEDPLRPVDENYVPVDPAGRGGSDGSGPSGLETDGEETDGEGVIPTFDTESFISKHDTGYVPDYTAASSAEGMNDTTGSSPILGRALNASTNEEFEAFLDQEYRQGSGAAAEPAQAAAADQDRCSTESDPSFNKWFDERLKALESRKSKAAQEGEPAQAGESALRRRQLSVPERSPTPPGNFTSEDSPSLSIQPEFSPSAPPYKACAEDRLDEAEKAQAPPAEEEQADEAEKAQAPPAEEEQADEAEKAQADEPDPSQPGDDPGSFGDISSFSSIFSKSSDSRFSESSDSRFPESSLSVNSDAESSLSVNSDAESSLSVKSDDDTERDPDYQPGQRLVNATHTPARRIKNGVEIAENALLIPEHPAVRAIEALQVAEGEVQAALVVEAQAADEGQAAPADQAAGGQPRRGRGRPKGSKNRPKDPKQADGAQGHAKRGRGRPKGSKNKAKEGGSQPPQRHPSPPRSPGNTCPKCGKEMGEGGLPDALCADCERESRPRHNLRPRPPRERCPNCDSELGIGVRAGKLCPKCEEAWIDSTDPALDRP